MALRRVSHTRPKLEWRRRVDEAVVQCRAAPLPPAGVHQHRHLRRTNERYGHRYRAMAPHAYRPNGTHRQPGEADASCKMVRPFEWSETKVVLAQQVHPD